MKRNKPYTTEEYISTVSKTHNNFYTYSYTIYTRSKDKVIITCPIHGNFKQRADDHRKGAGCPKCKSDKQSQRQFSSAQTFIKKALSVHGTTYTYNNVCYTNSKTPINITCSIHGDFSQRPSDHLQGKGCAKCGRLKNKNNIWSYTGWVEAGNKSKQFQGFSVYVIECWNDTERFIKIGKTYTDIHKRFRNLPYEYKVLEQHYGSGQYIAELETKLHSTYEEFSYLPSISFGGKFECFGISQKIRIIENLKKEIYDYTGANTS